MCQASASKTGRILTPTDHLPELIWTPATVTYRGRGLGLRGNVPDNVIQLHPLIMAMLPSVTSLM